MKHSTPLALAALTTFAGAAIADTPPRLTDAQYIDANRCLGLMRSKPLTSPEAAALAAVIRAQDWGRVPLVEDEADSARRNAQTDADHAGPDELATLTAQRDGVCHSYVTGAAARTSA